MVLPVNLKVKLLLLGIPVSIFFLLFFYATAALQPQMKEIERKFHLPEFQGTAHQMTIRFTLEHLRRRALLLRRIIFALGIFDLVLAAVLFMS